jgi:hypothetical protein
VIAVGGFRLLTVLWRMRGALLRAPIHRGTGGGRRRRDSAIDYARKRTWAPPSRGPTYRCPQRAKHLRPRHSCPSSLDVQPGRGLAAVILGSPPPRELIGRVRRGRPPGLRTRLTTVRLRLLALGLGLSGSADVAELTDQ